MLSGYYEKERHIYAFNSMTFLLMLLTLILCPQGEDKNEESEKRVAR